MSRIHFIGRRSTESGPERPEYHHEAAAGDAKASLRRRRVGRRAMLAAMAAAGLLASSAQAASTTPGDFSSYVPGTPTVDYVDDCTVEVGPVVDSVAYPAYRKIGGVRVDCASVHSVIQTTVWEQYWDGSQWVDWASGSDVGYDESATGIITSSPVCNPDAGPRYWRTAALVQTENVVGSVYSAEAPDSSGC